MDINKIATNVCNKADFLTFMDALIDDYKSKAKDWENQSLDDYLEALKACIEDMEGFYKYNNIDIPQNIPWFIFSNALMSARIYE